MFFSIIWVLFSILGGLFSLSLGSLALIAVALTILSNRERKWAKKDFIGIFIFTLKSLIMVVIGLYLLIQIFL